MVAGFVVRRRLPFQQRDAAKEKLYWEHNSGKALLQSSVNDADLVTDWIYYYQTWALGDADAIPRWLRTLQLASCISGTLSWIAIASDGRVMDWIRWAFMWIVVGLLSSLVFLFLSLPVRLFSCLRRNQIGNYHNVRGIESRLEDCEWSLESGIIRVRSAFETGFRFASGAVLFHGILMEDVPQILVTFLVEDVIKSDEAMGMVGNASGAAQINLVFAIFDICHKLAEAYDLRNDVVKTGDAAALTIRGHSGRVSALAPAGGSLFVSGSDDGAWRSWDAVAGKPVGSLV
uniref:Uncharacterized protein n=1 Tax=Corethron hystrix TaxID=216773 RepID=A0A7S1BH35_9STRA|mmetsp:Transcript_27430/g.62985  ORF Transcript_27430/g.62985 Transcript_27430/m.62985 type:complete len:289 (+) Transcript_27430:129-995(+)